jgi:hypothetical protein
MGNMKKEIRATQRELDQYFSKVYEDTLREMDRQQDNVTVILEDPIEEEYEEEKKPSFLRFLIGFLLICKIFIMLF